MSKEELNQEVQQIVSEYPKKTEEIMKKRGEFKLLLREIRDNVSKKYVHPPYRHNELECFCWLTEIIEELCWQFDIIPDIYLISVGTGVGAYLLNSIINCQDYDVIRELNNQYEMDYESYFRGIYDGHFTKETLARIGQNIRHGYPVYCVLMRIKEAEKDARIERGKLGDITQLNAPVELGGFGYARPTAVIDNRQIVIEDKGKLLAKYVDKVEVIEEKDGIR